MALYITKSPLLPTNVVSCIDCILREQSSLPPSPIPRFNGTRGSSQVTSSCILPSFTAILLAPIQKKNLLGRHTSTVSWRFVTP